MYSKSVMARRHSKTFDNTCGGDLGSAILYFCKERNDETQHYPQAGKFVLVPMQDLKPYQHMCSGHLWKNKAYITKYYKVSNFLVFPVERRGQFRVPCRVPVDSTSTFFQL